MNQCRQVRAQLERLVGVNRETWPVDVASHVSACPACGRTVASERLTRGLLRAAASAEHEPGPAFRRRVRAAIQTGPGRATEPGDLWKPARMLLPAFGIVATALLILFLQGDPPTGPAVADWPGLGESSSAGEQLLLATGPPDRDLVLAVVFEGIGR